MKQIFVLKDTAMVSNKALGALADGELGTLGIDNADGLWKPIAKNADAENVMFAVGFAGKNDLVSPVIMKDSTVSLETFAYQAEVLPIYECVIAGGTGLGYGDDFSITAYKNDLDGTKLDEYEKFTVTGQFVDLPALNVALKDKINTTSKLFTAAATATKVIITAKKGGIYTFAGSYNKDVSNPAATPNVTFTFTNPTTYVPGVGTPTHVKNLVKTIAGSTGYHETTNTYITGQTEQSVTGTKYTIVKLTYTENRPIEPTIKMANTSVELYFACDITAVTPTDVAGAIKTFVDEFFLGIVVV